MSEQENTETPTEQQSETLGVTPIELVNVEATPEKESASEAAASENPQTSEESPESPPEAPKETLILGDKGEIIWNDEIIAQLSSGNPHLEPKFEIIREELNREETRIVVTERLNNWLEDMLHSDLFPLFRLKSAIEHIAPPETETEIQPEAAPTEIPVAAETTEATEAPVEVSAETGGENVESPALASPPASSAASGHVIMSDDAKIIAQKLLDAHGILNRAYVEKEVAALTQDVRKSLRVLGIRFGRSAVYFPLLLKPKAVRLNAILGFLSDGAKAETPFLPPVGVTSFEADDTRSEKEYDLIGFRNIAGRSIRIDILDRVLDVLYEAQKEAKGPVAMPQSVVSFLGVSNEIAEKVVEALGWSKQTDDEGKVLWQYRRPKPPRNFKPRPPQDGAPEGGNRDASSFKRPAHSRTDNQFNGKKRKDNKGGKPKTARDYSSSPRRNDGDSPFAILASLKLGDKKD